MRIVRWIVALTVLIVLGTAGIPALRWIDIHCAGEAAKDAWGRWMRHEDWSGIAPLAGPLDYRWLAAAGRPVRIAHALGEAGLPGQNTVQAMRRSVARGLRLLEIDVWLDETQRLRCHHGPRPPLPWFDGDCGFDEVLQHAIQSGAWLVLDIKTDFARTGEQVLASIADDNSAKHVIFQLYGPHDVELFERWSRQRRLAGPLVTAYLARRSLEHVAQHTTRLGIKVLTVPLYRLPALSQRTRDLVVLTHPVHDCEAARQAREVDGMYLRSDLIDALSKGCAS
jgi:hypothetical protein